MAQQQAEPTAPVSHSRFPNSPCSTVSQTFQQQYCSNNRWYKEARRLCIRQVRLKRSIASQGNLPEGTAAAAVGSSAAVGKSAGLPSSRSTPGRPTSCMHHQICMHHHILHASPHLQSDRKSLAKFAKACCKTNAPGMASQL